MVEIVFLTESFNDQWISSGILAVNDHEHNKQIPNRDKLGRGVVASVTCDSLHPIAQSPLV